MISSAISVVSVHVGRIAPLAGGRPSAFVKRAVAGPVAVDTSGLAGDDQADRRYHGGVEKAVYGYDVAAYSDWVNEFPALAEHFVPGGMAENLALTGWSEHQVCIGDCHRIGTALLQVTQSREPCATMTRALSEPRLARAMIRNGRSGWYYRVLETGLVAAGDTATLAGRTNPHWTVARFAAFTFARVKGETELTELATMSGLAPQWQARAARLLGREAPAGAA